MSYVLTNKTAQTPLGFGALGVAVQPGESLTVTAAQAKALREHPVIAGWVAEGKLSVEQAASEAVPAPEVEPEAPPVPPVPEVVPPKVPAPTPTAKK